MAAVRDPAFWKRFSVAVHQDDQEKEERQQRPELKHSYVTSLSSAPSTATTFPTKDPYRISRPPPILTGDGTKRTSIRISTHILTPGSPTKTPALNRWPSISSPTITRQPSKLKKSPPPPTSSSHPYTPTLPSRQNPQPAFTTRHGNGSQMTLGLSGRPPSRFKFWTSITAGANNNRDSWLEAQLKKKRQRTWMCWLFWLIFLALVAGVVIVVLLLKAKHIIK
ncbi:hypothetical protein BDV96DRAFT_690783 [Lophiotrema nucula]|uniref:Uncharacterized protein n=1 Tax=Lophiotrema nucula TaxID=690887 RepID=A0A6A5YUQ5_9PLEO|nr:hypothetical protein BDV96DRAFT_690783 [Lophiotrema nucula]